MVDEPSAERRNRAWSSRTRHGPVGSERTVPCLSSTKTARSQREPRLYLLLFDLTFAVPARLAHAQVAADKAVEESNPATDLFSVATYSATGGVTFVTPFLRDALALTITRDERQAWKDFTGGANTAGATAKDAAADQQLIETLHGGVANQEMAGARTSRLIEDEVDGIGEAADRLRMLQGQKHVLLFTQGFDTQLVHGLTRDVGPPHLDARLLRKLDEMARRFRLAGVMLDSADVAGRRQTLDSRENEALWMLARGTGGQVLHNENDLAAGIAGLTESQQVVSFDLPPGNYVVKALLRLGGTTSLGFARKEFALR